MTFDQVQSCVLDSSALLAYLNREPGSESVRQALYSVSKISYVNWAEVLTKSLELGSDPERLQEQLYTKNVLGRTLLLEPFTDDDCIETARLRPLTRHLGLGIGDRACLALGKRLNLPVLTADKQWATLNIGVTVNLIR